MDYQEGDIVRVRSWSGTWRVSSVMERPPLAYVREVDGLGKGYIEQKNLELIERAKPEPSNQLTIF